MRVLVFGDSITQGYWAVEHGWVDRLRAYYDERQSQNLKDNDEPTIFNLGISADNSFNILDRIKPETIARTRHELLPVVIVQIGVNDSSERKAKEGGVGGIPVTEYEENLVKIIDMIRPYSSKIIFVGFSSCDESQTTPVFWGDYYYRNHKIKEYEEVMGKVAQEHGVDFIPVFDEFKKALDEGQELLPDGLHPNDEGHELIYSLVKQELEKML